MVATAIRSKTWAVMRGSSRARHREKGLRQAAAAAPNEPSESCPASGVGLHVRMLPLIAWLAPYTAHAKGALGQAFDSLA